MDGGFQESIEKTEQLRAVDRNEREEKKKKKGLLGDRKRNITRCQASLT